MFASLFKKYGLPAAIRSDNGTPFASTALGRLSELSVWWIQTGHQPGVDRTGQAATERAARANASNIESRDDAPAGSQPCNQQQRLFNRFIREYNEVRPHEGIELKTPASLYEASRRSPKEVPELVYPAHFETRLVSKNSGIRWNSQWVAVSQTCAGLHVGLEQVDHGLWDVYLGPVKLGRLLEERLRIEDHLGRLVRKNV